MSKPFNGHKNWNHWNVSLWINNDEQLYSLAKHCIEMANNKPDAALNFQAMLGQAKTPDGAPYSVSSILAAMKGM